MLIPSALSLLLLFQLAQAQFPYSVSTLRDGSGTPFTVPRSYATVFDSAGNLFVAGADVGNYRILRLTLAGVSSVYAGTGATGSADGTAASSTFNNPRGLAFDAAGNLFVADTSNHRIRKITPAGVGTNCSRH